MSKTKTKKITPGFYIIHAGDRLAWGIFPTFEEAEEKMVSDKWMKSWCYVGNHEDIDNFKQITIETVESYFKW